jgi:sugar lactone lactonase YvrE
MTSLLLGWLALSACTGSDGDDTDPPTPVPTLPTGDTAIVSTADTAPPVPTADTGPSVDCSVPPPLPVPFITGYGFGTAEDFDIDYQGRHISADGNLVAYDPTTGDTELISPNVGYTACTRMLPSGDFIYCDVGNNALVFVDAATGAKSPVATGLQYPNGGEVDPDGYVYVAEQSAGRVRRVDPATGDSLLIANGLNNPNGVIWGPGYQTLYVASFGGGMVYAIERTGPDTFAPATILVQNPGFDGGFDGINVDECGNVYITEYVAGKVWRILPDGSDVSLVADLPSSWIPNMRWGNGVNGFDETTLYVSDRNQGRLFGLQMGLRGKPPLQPPVVP